jgi:2-dehydro-3-deoxyphosphogluconate aldolase / (4S)-4-hydroxy-2-oxoglutarate aldolase
MPQSRKGKAMTKEDTLARIRDIGLVAVIRGPSAELTLQMVEALVAGGVKGIEITYSTPGAEGVVSALADRYGDTIVLGMGTLTDGAQAKTAQRAGAGYLVSPICDADLVRAMLATGLPTMAGALTPTEIFLAHRLGTDVVKLFPGSLTGPGYVRALKGPFPNIPLMPTGGVSAANVAEWFAAGVIAVGAGSELCPPQLAKEGRFDEITRRASEFVSVVQHIRAAR